MLLKIYKENQPTIMVLLPLAVIFFWLPAFLKPVEGCFPGSATTPLYNALSAYICGSKTLALVISVILVLGGAVLLNYVCSAHEILLRQSNLPALFYITYCSFHENLLAFHPILPASVIIILALHRLFDAYRRDTAYSQVFDAGLLISIATLFFPPSIMFIPVAYISFIIFRPFIWREWVIILVGFCLPFFFVFIGYFYADNLNGFYTNKAMFSFSNRNFAFDISLREYVIFSLLFVFNFFAFWKLVPGLAKSKLKTRKTYNFMVWVTVFIALIFFFSPSFSVLYFSLFAIPLSMLSSAFVFLQKKTWVSEALYYLLLFFVVYGHIQ